MTTNQETTILGFDPSLRNWGYCIAKYNEQTKHLSFSAGGVIKSKPEDFPRKNLEDYQSACQLITGLHEQINTHNPDFIVAELPVGSQSARAMVSYGVCIALTAAVSHQSNKPVLAITPQEVKATVGKKGASKEEVIDWVKQNYPEVTHWLDELPMNKQEHICDAIVATHTAILN